MSKILLLIDPLNYDKRKVIEVPAGMTIAEMRVHKDIKKIINPVEKVTVSRMGEIIPFENYDTDIIHPNDYLMVLPKCGDDDTIKAVAMVGLLLIAGPAGGAVGGGFWGTVVTIAIMVGGGMLISGIGAKPGLVSAAMTNPDDYSQAYGWNPITTQQQSLKIARVYGKILVQGNLIEGYRIVTGDDTNFQTLYTNIGIGEGPIYMPVVEGTLEVNDQTIENFNDVYYSTRYGNMIQETIGWSQRCHFEKTPFIKVTNSDGAKIYETKGNLFDSLIIDVSFPRGLYDGRGALANHIVNITLEIKKASASTWVVIADGVDITADVNTLVIRSYNTDGIIVISRGEKYQVRLTKNTDDKNDVLWGDELYLDTVKEVTHEEFQQPGLASVNLNVLATGQLSGSLRASWITLGKYVRRWTGAAWEIVYNNSLAWVIYDVFTQPVFTGYHSPWLDLKLMLNFEGADAATETIDESPKGHAITFGGSAEIDTAEYKFGSSSVILDGTDSDLQIANDGRSFNICHNVNENWTIDFFVKMANHTGTEFFATQYEDTNNNWHLIHIDTVGLVFRNITGGSIKIDIYGVGEITDTDWHHIAVIKVGNNIGLYVDGVQIGYDLMIASDVSIIDGDLFIGQRGNDNDWFDGHVDHLRIVQNNIFSAAPNAGLTDRITNLYLEQSLLNLNLLLHFNGVDGATSTIDSSPKNHTVTFTATAEIDTAQKKFGVSSLLLDGNSDDIRIANDGESFDICENVVDDWTIDLFVKFTDHAGIEVCITQYKDNNNRWRLYNSHGVELAFILTVSGVNLIIASAIEITDTDWHHIAVCKVGVDIGFYVDGTQVGYDLMIASDAVIIDGDLFIGQRGNNLDWFDGHIDHLRIVNNNIFSAAPNDTHDDAITVPDILEYTDPGNSYVDAEHEAYTDSKLDLPSFTALETWCDAVRVNPISFGIISISQATYAVIVTTSKHNFTIGDKILFRGVSISGMIELVDETTATVLKVTNNVTFTIDLDTSGFAAYTGAEPKLLIYFDGAHGSVDFTDETSVHTITTIGDTQVSVNNPKFGIGSGWFPGSDDALSIPDHADWDIFASNADNWTIDFFVKHTSLVGFAQDYVEQTVDIDNGWAIYYKPGSGLAFTVLVADVDIIWSGYGDEITDLNWHHIALCKKGNEYGLYLDGIQVCYIQNNNTATFAGKLYIGSFYSVAEGYLYEFKGYMDELCIINNNRFNASPNIGKTDTIVVPANQITLGIGTIEEYLPRFAFNGVVDTDKNLWETAIHLCKLCRAVPYMKGSKIAIAINKSTSSSYMFNMANIDAGSFKEFFLPKNERAYEITSQFRNKAADYKRQGSPIPNPNILNTSNRITQDRFGITDKTTVDDLSRFELLENEYIDLAVQFRGDVDAIPVKIGDVVDFTHDVSNWHKIGQLSEHYTGSGQIRRAINGATAIITINGKVNFVDADFDGGSLTYKVKIKMSDDSMELKTITGHTVVDGEHSILVAGPFDMTPKPGDMWSAGQENLQTRTFRVSNMRTTQILKSDILLTQYVETCFEND